MTEPQSYQLLKALFQMRDDQEVNALFLTALRIACPDLDYWWKESKYDGPTDKTPGHAKKYRGYIGKFFMEMGQSLIQDYKEVTHPSLIPGIDNENPHRH